MRMVQCLSGLYLLKPCVRIYFVFTMSLSLKAGATFSNKAYYFVMNRIFTLLIMDECIYIWHHIIESEIKVYFVISIRHFQKQQKKIAVLWLFFVQFEFL